MENSRSSWGSNFGFLMAAIGSAVGLGNIWGFPYKMGKSGGLTFLIVYLLLAVFVGMVVMVSELAIGRKTGKSIIAAYSDITKRYRFLGWLGILAPFLIMSFYSVLGGYSLQYMSLNMAELSFDLTELMGKPIGGNDAFGAMLVNPAGCCVFTLLFLAICLLIVRSGVESGVEKFNKIGMPALAVMLVIIIIRGVTLPGAVEGLKFMFVPGYAVSAGFVTEAPSLLSVLGTAGGQMFFSLSLAMGVMITYGSYLDKKENLAKNSVIIVIADTIVALMAGFAVIPAAVANGLSAGMAPADIQLGGPKLLFVTLQDVFSNMGTIGPLFGVVFYLLVLIAAISSAISLMEVIASHFIDKAVAKGKVDPRKRIVLFVSAAIAVEALLVAVDGLGSNGIAPMNLLGMENAPVFMQDWLDFMDCWSEGLAMPVGAMLMCIMVGWEQGPRLVLDEVQSGATVGKGLETFYTICIRFVAPIIMAFVLAGQIESFFGVTTVSYVISFALLAVFWIITLATRKKSA